MPQLAIESQVNKQLIKKAITMLNIYDEFPWFKRIVKHFAFYVDSGVGESWNFVSPLSLALFSDTFIEKLFIVE